MQQQVSPHYAFAHYFAQDKLFPFLYALSLRMSEGNLCLNLNHMPENDDILNYHQDNKHIVYSHPLVNSIENKDDIKPFVLRHDKLYTQRYFSYEGSFIKKIKELILQESIDQRFESLIQKKDLLYGNLFPISTSIDWQLIACIAGYINQFTIITGGPGTGKTTSVSKLLALLLSENPELKILLAAPTGKAASRMKESQGRVFQQFQRQQININSEILKKISELEASTIHSLLGYIPNSIHFKHGSENPLDADVLIIDECSMIDIAIFKKLLDAVDPFRTKVILLGDKHQLASVEAGSLFGDLCKSVEDANQFDSRWQVFLEKIIGWKVIPSISVGNHPLNGNIIELQKSFRFDDAMGIGKLSKAILQCDTVAINNFCQNADDSVQIHSFSKELIQEYAQKLIEGYVQEQNILNALKMLNDSKILCATHSGRGGVNEINMFVSQYLLRHIGNDANVFFENKMIMITKNQPDIDLYNGDIGIIRDVADETGEKTRYACFLKSENEYIKVIPTHIHQWTDAYAITIHKSQGSEFDDVLISLSDKSVEKMLTRELVYTAITRAKNRVDIIADADILIQASKRSVERISGIKDRILE